jgi:hypothetical protein
VAHERRVALVEIADIIKVEMHRTVAGGENRNAGRICDGAGSGVCTFQAYFFRHPETMSTHDMPANRMNYLGMLQEESRPKLELSELEKLVKAEASVCYRRLRYLNSTIFGWRAGGAVGEAGGGGGCGAGKNSDLVLSALVRGRFGE